MATPSKRRKTNNHNNSQRPVKNLDYFFGSQKAKIPSTPQQSTQDVAGEAKSAAAKEPEQHLTDEQLALNLQQELNAADRGHDVTEVRQKTAPKNEKHEEHAHVKAGEEALTDSGATLQLLVSAQKRQEDEPINPLENEVKLPKGNILSLQSTTSAENAISSVVPFDENPMTFDPSKYLPDLKKHWATHDGEASYGLLTRCFVLVNGTKKRNKIVDMLVNFLRTIIEADPDSLLPAVWLTINAISPSYISLELGLGGSAISKTLKSVYGLNNAGLKALYDKKGDAGDVAFEAKKRQTFTFQKPKALTIKGVFQNLVKVANSKGTGSQESKQRIIDRMVQAAQGAEESRYLVRTLVRNLRIGAVETTVLIALSRAFLMSKPPGADFSIKKQEELAKLDEKSLAEVYSRGERLVKACFARRPNHNDLVPCLLNVGISDELLVRCGLTLHIPLRPMLGSITRDLAEMLTKLQGRDFSCEYKYDGQRAQVHCDGDGKVSIFSRKLEVMTDKYPDLVALVPKIRGEGVSSFIIDGEVVAVDQKSGDLEAFQTLTNRAKKDVAIDEIKIAVCLFAFDLMYLNGEELFGRPFRERRELLRSLFVEVPYQFTWVKSIDATSADSETVLEFFKGALDIKCEGIMVKILDNVPNPELLQPGDEAESEEKPPPTPSKASKKKGKASAAEKTEAKEKGSRRKALLATYEPNKRLDSWLKVKKDYDTAADTIDLIPIAAWHGQGRKANWWSPILLAVRNPETGSLEAVTKCISGFTDKFYQANKEKYSVGSNNLISRPSYVEYRGGHPDVWFEPQEVWEMAFADITKSPTYLAAIGLVAEDRGLSMRFPRFLKVREDKGIEEASTSEFLAELWRKQAAKGPQAESGGNVAEQVDDEQVEDDEWY
ncbi:MAG: hypothetical protein L6R41_003922 [Letrouitia leprolyta]|nr:MAG: hypothetical protein L6R41_003922 [Letrouitia leprolyta]